MLLMPVGIINERHEPPVFYGVERPLVETVIIPTTWFEVGAGVHGELGRGWRYRAYLTAPLNAARVQRRGRPQRRPAEGQPHQHQPRRRRPGRLEYVGVRGLTAGASFWAGDSGFEFQPRFDVPVRLYDADVRYAPRPLRGPRASSRRSPSPAPPT